MEKKWLLRLPKDLDDWLTLKAAEETVVRGKRVSKNTLIVELAANVREARESDLFVKPAEAGSWQDVKSALVFIQRTIERKAYEDSPISDRMKQRISVNFKLLESYLEDLED